MHPAEASVRSPVSILIKSLWARNSTSDVGNGLVVLILQHNLYPPSMTLLPFTIEEGTRVAQHWTGGWDTIIAWPGHRDLSRDQWELLSQTFRVFYYFAHERRETIVAWPSFLRAYLLLAEVGKCFGEVVAPCGEMQLVLLIAWANSYLPESLVSFQTLFQHPNEVEGVVNVGPDSEGQAEVAWGITNVDWDVDELSDWQHI